MKEAIEINVTENLLENYRHEILCEDIIKKLRPAIEQYAVEVRHFVRESMYRGFDRAMIRHSIALFQAEIINLIMMAEDSLVLSNSPKARILENELRAFKASIGVFFKTSEEVILEEPDIDDQMFGGIGRVG